MEHEYRNQLERIGGGPETIEAALHLIRQAKLRTGPGSGHELGGEYSTSLVPICGLIASERAKNGEITTSSAQPASCLNKAKFTKAYQIIDAALAKAATGAQRITYDGLLQKFVAHPLLRAQLTRYCKDAQSEGQKLGMNSAVLKSKEVVCGIFFWVCTTAKVSELPEIQDFASEYGLSTKKLQEFGTKLSKTLPSLRREISRESRAASSAGPSPVKTPVVSTPRRPIRQPRALPTNDSPKKRLIETPSSNPDTMLVDETDAPVPETPTKKRRLVTTVNHSPTPPALNFPASSSRVTLDATPPPDRAQEIHTPRRNAATASRSSPLKRSFTQTEVDVEMKDADPLSETEEEDEPESRSFRRFRPVYLEQKQWSARDPRLKRMWRLREQQKQKLIELYGHPIARAKA